MPATKTETETANRRFVVGGVGHRELPANTNDLEASIEQAFRDLIAAQGGTPDQVELIVSLAEGADRLLIESALGLGMPYVCVLPCSPDCFADDFPTSSSVETFECLLAGATDIVQPVHDSANRVDGYLWVSRYILDNCDLLLAVWDGEDGNGPGGTAHTVEIATQNKIPVLQISAIHPHTVVVHDPL